MFVFPQNLQLQQQTTRTGYSTIDPFHSRYKLEDNNNKKG